MLIIIIDYKRVVHYEFIPEGTYINKHTYKEISVCLRDSIRREKNQLFHKRRLRKPTEFQKWDNPEERRIAGVINQQQRMRDAMLD
ncbi:hypothetical protein LAZ67_X003897 [Cordylochernes scorpioides]|uniref:Uncharacterized protein n=1 Tax=Cordylochernes scorpioides TaxID=51811 RepID=A0ABY6LUY8_9ARAC|nr:hypothetical protein LAZ67_X003897 [Cordylochernes scorpioides]